jgi:hypothetical protein
LDFELFRIIGAANQRRRRSGFGSCVGEARKRVVIGVPLRELPRRGVAGGIVVRINRHRTQRFLVFDVDESLRRVWVLVSGGGGGGAESELFYLDELVQEICVPFFESLFIHRIQLFPLSLSLSLEVWFLRILCSSVECIF